MIAIITVGDCELVVLRRVQGQRAPLELVCHTEMPRGAFGSRVLVGSVSFKGTTV